MTLRNVLRLAFAVTLSLWLIDAHAQSSANYEITRSVMSGGGGPSTSTSFDLTGTLGQPSPSRASPTASRRALTSPGTASPTPATRSSSPTASDPPGLSSRPSPAPASSWSGSTTALKPARLRLPPASSKASTASAASRDDSLGIAQQDELESGDRTSCSFRRNWPARSQP